MEKTRFYQSQIFEKAKRENVICVGPTGSGKTHVAALLMSHFYRKARKNGTLDKLNMIFIVHKVLLVHQQHCYLLSRFRENKIPIRLGKFWGEANGSHYWRKRRWTDQVSQNQGIVLTAQILLNNLSHGFVNMSEIDLLIFDECHHTQKYSPYNRIMRDFYFPWVRDNKRVPKIFGMSASPMTYGRSRMGRTSKWEMRGKLSDVQTSLDSTVYVMGYTSGDPRELVELHKHVKTPKLLLQDYKFTFEGSSKIIFAILLKFNEKYETNEIITRFIIQKMFILYELGTWGLWQYLIDVQKTLKTGDKRNEFYNVFIQDHDVIPNSDMNLLLIIVEILIDKFDEHEEGPLEHHMSKKVQTLVKILELYKKKHKDFCGLVFVERRNIAYCLSKIINAVKSLKINCDFLVGRGGNRSGKKKKKDFTKKNFFYHMGSNKQQLVMRQFGKLLDLVIATSVAEEGIDIQACHLVIRFNLFSDMRGFIQSKGRSRKQNSDFVMMYDENSKEQKKIIKNIKKSEQQLLMTCVSGVKLRRKHLHSHKIDHAYTIMSTGARVTLNDALTKLHHYCSRLPSDMYTGALKPRFRIQGNRPRVQCICTLPNNANISEPIVGWYCKNEKLAIQSACLETIKMLHEKKLLDDNLLPITEHNIKAIERNLEEKWREVNSEKENLRTYEVVTSSMLLRRNWLNETNVELFLYTFKLGKKIAPLGMLTSCKFDVGIPLLCMNYRTKKGSMIDEGVKLSLVGSIKLNSDQIDILKRFHMFLFSICAGYTFKCFGEKIYLVVPIANKISLGKINWKVIIATLRKCGNVQKSACSYDGNDDLIEMSSNKNATASTFGKNAFIEETFENGDVVKAKSDHKIFIFRRKAKVTTKSKFINSKHKSYYDMLKSKFPQYTTEKMAEKYSHPLIEVTRPPRIQNVLRSHVSRRERVRERNLENKIFFLPCGIFERLPFTIEILEFLQQMPGIFWYFENYLIVQDLNMILKTPLNLQYLKEAVTATSTQEYRNYERLEFFGDSILKYIVCQDLFFRFPQYHEGILTRQKRIIISNNYLMEKNIKNKLFKFCMTEMFTPRKWRPPGYDKSKKQVILNNKKLSDMVESLTAVAYLTGGLNTAKSFLIDLGFPIENEFLMYYKKLNYFEKVINIYKERDLFKLEDILNYKFSNKTLFVRALTHQSYRDYDIHSYQRLEFLGDAILDMIITEYFYDKYKHVPPSILSDLRSYAVSNEFFAYVTVQNGLQGFMLHKSERIKNDTRIYTRRIYERDGEISHDSPKFLGDIFESIAGAVFIDCGFDIEIVKKIFFPLMNKYLKKYCTLDTVKIHPVRKLCELLQRNRIVDFKFTMGIPSEKNKYRANCVFTIRGIDLILEEGQNKIAARKKCAEKAFKYLQRNTHFLNPNHEMYQKKKRIKLIEMDKDANEDDLREYRLY